MGIVTDAASASDKSDPAASQHDKNTSQALLAGILLSSPTSSSHTKTLGDVIEQTKTTDDVLAEKIQHWRTQIEEDMAQLHSLGIYWGGREDWFYINPYTVLIDAESGDASLSLDTAVFLDNDNDDDDAKSKDSRTKLTDMDNSAIKDLFEKWLPEELSEKRNGGS